MRGWKMDPCLTFLMSGSVAAVEGTTVIHISSRNFELVQIVKASFEVTIKHLDYSQERKNLSDQDIFMASYSSLSILPLGSFVIMARLFSLNSSIKKLVEMVGVIVFEHWMFSSEFRMFCIFFIHKFIRFIPFLHR